MKLTQRTIFCLAIGMLAGLPFSLLAQDSVTMTTITGQQIEMDLESIVDGVVQGGSEKISLSDLLMIQTDKSIVPERQALLVMLSGGGQIGASQVTFDGENFSLQTPVGQFSVPPDSIKAILMDVEADRSRFDRALKNRSVEKDSVIALGSSGQRVVGGLIESINESKLLLEFDGKSRPISLNKIVGIVPADLKPAKPKGQIVNLKLTNGSTVTGGIVGLQSGKLQLVLPGDATIELSLSAVSAISLQSDRVAYLSDLDPTNSSQNALATIEFAWQRDLSVQLNPIRLYSFESGKTTEYAKGIGVHSASRLEFENADDFDRFAAVVGIDAETQGNGDCEVSLWADGIQLWSANITGEGEPQKVDVPIKGMKTIALVVRNGKYLDLGDHVDWADARFLKTGDSSGE